MSFRIIYFICLTLLFQVQLMATEESMLMLRNIAENDPVEDYRAIAQSYPWDEVLYSPVKTRKNLLDVGCGTGRWLAAIQSNTNLCSSQGIISYDCVDPSSNAISHCQKTLHKPFQWGRGFATTIQEAPLPAEKYDFLWSFHSLYAVPLSELSIVLEKCHRLLKPGGQGWFALATKDAFYCQVYKSFQEEFQLGSVDQYISAEDVTFALERLNIPFTVHVIEYEEVIAEEDIGRLEHFIQNECIAYSFNRDHDPQMNDILSNSVMNEVITSHLKSGEYRFPQKIWLIEFRG